jgi:hypothetical protein
MNILIGVGYYLHFVSLWFGFRYCFDLENSFASIEIPPKREAKKNQINKYLSLSLFILLKSLQAFRIFSIFCRLQFTSLSIKH